MAARLVNPSCRSVSAQTGADHHTQAHTHIYTHTIDFEEEIFEIVRSFRHFNPPLSQGLPQRTKKGGEELEETPGCLEQREVGALQGDPAHACACMHTSIIPRQAERRKSWIDSKITIREGL